MQQLTNTDAQTEKKILKEYLLNNGFKFSQITNRFYKTLIPSDLAGITKEQMSIFIRENLSLSVKFVFDYCTSLGSNSTGTEKSFNNLEDLKIKYPRWFLK